MNQHILDYHYEKMVIYYAQNKPELAKVHLRLICKERCHA